MARPTYETNRDRAREREVRELLAAKWHCHAIPAADFACYDAILKRDGKTLGVVEIKCRQMSMSTYPTLWISKRKIDRLVEVCGKHPDNPKPLLVVALWDRVVGLELEPGSYDTERGGRTDRGDPADIELVYAIPWFRFNLIARRD